MDESREEIVSHLRALGESLGSVQEKLAGLERGLAEAKSEADSSIAAIRAFLEGGAVTRLSGPDPAAGADLSKANESIQKLALGENQERILEIFLQEAKHFVNRAVLFMRKDEEFHPFKSLGFPSDNLEGVVVDDPHDAIQRAATQKRIIYSADSVSKAFPWLDSSGPEPGAAVCVPLVFHDSVPAVFYGDAQSGISLDSLELLTHLTTLVLRNNYLELLLAEGGLAEAEPQTAVPPSPRAPEPPPAAAPMEPIAASPEPPVVEFAGVVDFDETSAVAPEEPAAAPEPMAAPEPVEEPLEPTEEPVPTEAAPAERETISVPAEPFTEVSRWDATAEDASVLDTPSHEQVLGEVEFKIEEVPQPHWGDETPVEAAPVEEAEAKDEGAFLSEMSVAEASETVAEPPSGQVEPYFGDPSAEPAPKPPQPPALEATPEVAEEPPLPREEWEKVEQEARRFARLLVSEIKLYNEDAVEQGRDEGDLYSRLRRDIDRSREMYEKRAHPAVRSREDFFHAELVRILAQGREDRLGPDYPGQKLS